MAKVYDIKSLREKALESDDIKNDSVFVDEWDAEFPVQSLRAADLKKVLTQSKTGKGEERDEVRMACLAVLYGCRTPEGEAVFTADDLAAFETKKAARPIMTISGKVMEISGFTNAKQAVSDAKNS
jgi:hypothetical protein